MATPAKKPFVPPSSSSSSRRRVSLSFSGIPSATKQSFRDGTTVDSVLKRYATIGVDGNDIGVFQQNVARATYGVADLTYDYQTHLNRVIRVQEYFKALPSAIRDRFQNDAANMLAFMADSKNISECVKLGLFAGDKKTGEPDTASPVIVPPVPAKPG